MTHVARCMIARSRVACVVCCALSQIDPKKGPYLIVAAAQRAGVEADFWINVRPCRAGYCAAWDTVKERGLLVEGRGTHVAE